MYSCAIHAHWGGAIYWSDVESEKNANIYVYTACHVYFVWLHFPKINGDVILVFHAGDSLSIFFITFLSNTLRLNIGNDAMIEKQIDTPT